MKTILVVDDQIEVVNSYRRVFEHEGFRIWVADTEQQVQEKIDANDKPDIVFLDIDLKGDGRDRSGLKILERLRQHWPQPQLPIIIVSGAGDTSLLIDSIHGQGADDYLIQPIDDYRGLLDMVNRFIELPQTIRNETEEKESAEQGFWKKEKIVGQSKRIMELTKEILTAAQHDCDTLILGETGTGKDLVAKTIHELSRRKHAPFFVISCPEIPKDLAESELFGYDGKSFTDAAPNGKKGKIEAANGGVVFFNEIGDLSLPHQSKILNFLETKEIMRVGSTQKIKLDVMVLAATNKELAEMVKRGEFRKDLYYRFSNIIISTPLREHLKDIPLLAQHFLENANAQHNKKVTKIDPDVIARFQKMPWDGNVRQLEKTIYYGAIHCKGSKIVWEDVASFLEKEICYEAGSEQALGRKNWDIPYAEFNQLLEREKSRLECEYYSYHLKQCGHNIAKTAEAIKIKSRPQLYQILKRLGIHAQETEE